MKNVIKARAKKLLCMCLALVMVLMISPVTGLAVNQIEYTKDNIEVDDIIVKNDYIIIDYNISKLSFFVNGSEAESKLLSTLPEYNSELEIFTEDGDVHYKYVFTGKDFDINAEKEIIYRVIAVNNYTIYSSYGKKIDLEEAFSITYSGLKDGYTIPTTAPTYYSYSSAEIVLPIPTTTDSASPWEFKGWYNNKEFTGEPIEKIGSGSTGDKVFYAKWTPIEYKITYNLDGGTEPTPANPTSYTVETETFSLAEPTKEGYTFEGWTGTGLSTPAKNVTIPKGKTGNLEFTANWTQIPGGGPGVNGGEGEQPSTTYTITYVLNGGTNYADNPATYTTEDTPITLADPTYDGYTFEGWYTDEALTEKAEAPQIPTGSEGDKTLYAKWFEIKAEEEDEKKQPVVFLPEDKNNNSAQWLALISSSKQIGAYLNGYADGTFRADAGMTRAEAAAIFARIHKDFSESSFYMPSYTDVSYGDWYAKYVGFIQKKGIADVLTGEYRPNDFITRAEFCTMLANCLAIKYSDNESPFSDVSDSRIIALAEKGLINGYDDGTFRPWLGITRAEVAKIVNIAIGRTYDGSHLANPYNDLDSTHWAYGEILKASKK